MKLRVLAVSGLIVAALFGAGCSDSSGGPSIGDVVSTGSNPSVATSAPQMGSSQPPVVIDNAAALKLALETAGITDVHPVKGKVAAWAAVPGFKKCPMYFAAVNGDSYQVTHLHKTDGTVTAMDMSGTTGSPTTETIVVWAANNTLTALSCRGSEAPAEKDWPTATPQ